MARRRIFALKNFDEELYRLVKIYAVLEGRTITSIVEEAVRAWIAGRGDYEDVSTWARLEEEYRRNVKALEGLRGDRGFALVCRGRVVGVFDSYYEAARKALELNAGEALIVNLSERRIVEELELGLPW
ncbi:MAG: hypothetical protein QW407_04095 [Thermofilaceae archaeon]